MKGTIKNRRTERRIKRSQNIGALLTFGDTTHIINHFACSPEVICRATRVVIYRRTDRLRTAIACFENGTLIDDNKYRSQLTVGEQLKWSN